MQFTIAGRLKLQVAAAALGIASMSILAWTQIDGLYTQTNFANVNTLPSYQDLDHAAQAAAQMQFLLWQHVSQPDASARVEIETRLAARQQQAVDALAKYEREDMDEPQSMYVPDKALLDADRALMAQLKTLAEKVIDLSRQGRSADARALLVARQQLGMDMAAALASHVKFNTDIAERNAVEAAALKQRTTVLIGGLGLFTLATVAAFGWALSRSIVGPLRTAVALADRVAAGDLTSALPPASGDELGALLQALVRMQDNLIATVGAVRRNAESVATASVQIAHGNQDLSSRTELQAATLEQTASSMEALGSAVQQNSGHAAEADRLALAAREVAQHGGRAVDDVVRTMEDINGSSRKIGAIITVIDSIAFQTNILALNAAVEAARAGDSGRGFAVVATEVRNLAHRSAEAAREIKALVTASVESAERGGALVGQAGRTMQEVVASTQRVSDVVAQISGASGDQSEGVAKVATAVHQMDHATQQNAALVEQSAAAAESLSEQARALVAAVSRFRLSA